VVVALDHEPGVRVLAAAEHRVLADAAIERAVVAESLEEHLPVERLDQHHLAHTEDGLGEINCDKFPLARSFDDVLAALTELATDSHSYETVVIDSLDWLERLIWDAVCKRESATTIEKVGGGYGKGYILALDFWRKFIERLVALHTGLYRQDVRRRLARLKAEPGAAPDGRQPVLSLLPVPGCIDLVVASELLEAVRTVGSTLFPSTGIGEYGTGTAAALASVAGGTAG
jgi:hypothetical protein